jgi:hypothetical protein
VKCKLDVSTRTASVEVVACPLFVGTARWLSRWGSGGVRFLARAVIAAAAVTCVLALCQAGVARGAAWRLEPTTAPSPPSGAAPAPYPVPLGEVGEISFWAPNRGLLITGGTNSQGGAVPGGLYAYDGVGWHELASECGGANGRIAWAGPDEFWTISDQRAGQITSLEETNGELESLSLCHFQGDQIVGSYAMPLGEPGSYLQMDAAACLSPSDCWFAGEDGRSPDTGAFHLHWSGSEVSASYDPEDHAVTGMASFDGKIYEGLAIGPEDTYLPEEYAAGESESAPPKHPAVIRTIAPAGHTQPCRGVLNVFCDEFLFSGQTLPIYQEKSLPDALGGFDVASDGAPLGAEARLGAEPVQLWAGADPLSRAAAGSGPGKLTILHGNAEGDWAQILPAKGSLGLGEALLQGSATDDFTSQTTQVGSAIAPVPGTESAWLSLSGDGNSAHVALLEANGTVAEEKELPEAGEAVGDRGQAGPIACPAREDCWMATSEGWLFHLNGGGPLAPNTDPLFDGEDGVIAYRPPDAGLPGVYPDGFAEDDSLANEPPAPPVAPAAAVTSPKPPAAKKAKPLVKDLKSRFLHHRMLVITFILTASAHVQLIARKQKRVVAKTRREALRAGAHRLSLSLDPARWPTKLSFEAEPIGAPTSSSPEGSEAGDTVST